MRDMGDDVGEGGGVCEGDGVSEGDGVCEGDGVNTATEAVMIGRAVVDESKS